MKAKNILTLFSFFLIFGNSYAQEESSSRTFAVKNYFSFALENDDINFQYGHDDLIVKDSNQVRQFYFFRPAFTIYSAKDIMHEFELIDLKLIKRNSTTLTDLFNPDSLSTITNGDFEVKETGFSFRYQFSVPVLRIKEIFYLGASLNPYYSKVSNNNKATEIAERRETIREVMGVNIYVVPHWMYSINEKLFIDFRAMAAIAKLENVDYSQTFLGENDRKEFQVKDFSLTKLEFSLGIGYKF